jgi:hypothetical protein
MFRRPLRRMLSLGIGEASRAGDQVWIRCANIDDLALLGALLADWAG